MTRRTCTGCQSKLLETVAIPRPGHRSLAGREDQCQSLHKEANVSVRGYYCLFLADLQDDNFPVCSPPEEWRDWQSSWTIHWRIAIPEGTKYWMNYYSETRLKLYILIQYFNQLKRFFIYSFLVCFVFCFSVKYGTQACCLMQYFSPGEWFLSPHSHLTHCKNKAIRLTHIY